MLNECTGSDNTQGKAAVPLSLLSLLSLLLYPSPSFSLPPLAIWRRLAFNSFCLN